MLGAGAAVEVAALVVALEADIDAVGDVVAEAVDQLAADATTQWTGTFNPRSLNQADFRELYVRTL